MLGKCYINTITTIIIFNSHIRVSLYDTQCYRLLKPWVISGPHLDLTSACSRGQCCWSPVGSRTAARWQPLGPWCPGPRSAQTLLTASPRQRTAPGGWGQGCSKIDQRHTESVKALNTSLRNTETSTIHGKGLLASQDRNWSQWV